MLTKTHGTVEVLPEKNSKDSLHKEFFNFTVVSPLHLEQLLPMCLRTAIEQEPDYYKGLEICILGLNKNLSFTRSGNEASLCHNPLN